MSTNNAEIETPVLSIDKVEIKGAVMSTGKNRIECPGEPRQTKCEQCCTLRKRLHELGHKKVEQSKKQDMKTKLFKKEIKDTQPQKMMQQLRRKTRQIEKMEKKNSESSLENQVLEYQEKIRELKNTHEEYKKSHKRRERLIKEEVGKLQAAAQYRALEKELLEVKSRERLLEGKKQSVGERFSSKKTTKKLF